MAEIVAPAIEAIANQDRLARDLHIGLAETGMLASALAAVHESFVDLSKRGYGGENISAIARNGLRFAD